MESQISQPKLFSGTLSFSPEINRRIVQSEVEGGVDLTGLPSGTVLVVETENRSYRIEVREGRSVYISGHPQFCPDPTLVSITGSNWGGSMLKMGFIGRGMFLEFQHPEYKRIQYVKNY